MHLNSSRNFCSPFLCLSQSSFMPSHHLDKGPLIPRIRHSQHLNTFPQPAQHSLKPEHICNGRCGWRLMVSGWMTAHLKVKSLHHESSSTRTCLYLTKLNRKRLKRTLGNGKVLQRSQSGLLCHTVFTGTKNLRRNSTLGSSGKIALF